MEDGMCSSATAETSEGVSQEKETIGFDVYKEWVNISASVFTLLQANSAFKRAVLSCGHRCRPYCCMYCLIQEIILSKSVLDKNTFDILISFTDAIRSKYEVYEEINESLIQAGFVTILQSIQEQVSDADFNVLKSACLASLEKTLNCDVCLVRNHVTCTMPLFISEVKGTGGFPEQLKDAVSSSFRSLLVNKPVVCMNCQGVIKKGFSKATLQLPDTIMFKPTFQSKDPANRKSVIIPPCLQFLVHLPENSGPVFYRIQSVIISKKTDNGQHYPVYTQNGEKWTRIDSESKDQTSVSVLQLDDCTDLKMICWKKMAFVLKNVKFSSLSHLDMKSVPTLGVTSTTKLMPVPSATKVTSVTSAEPTTSQATKRSLPVPVAISTDPSLKQVIVSAVTAAGPTVVTATKVASSSSSGIAPPSRPSQAESVKGSLSSKVYEWYKKTTKTPVTSSSSTARPVIAIPTRKPHRAPLKSPSAISSIIQNLKVVSATVAARPGTAVVTSPVVVVPTLNAAATPMQITKTMTPFPLAASIAQPSTTADQNMVTKPSQSTSNQTKSDANARVAPSAISKPQVIKRVVVTSVPSSSEKPASKKLIVQKKFISKYRSPTAESHMAELFARKMYHRNNRMTSYEEFHTRKHLRIPHKQNMTHIITTLLVLSETRPLHEIMRQTVPCVHFVNQHERCLRTNQIENPHPDCLYCIFHRLCIDHRYLTESTRDVFGRTEFHGNQALVKDVENDVLEYLVTMVMKLQDNYSEEVMDSVFTVQTEEEMTCESSGCKLANNVTKMVGINFNGQQGEVFSVHQEVDSFFQDKVLKSTTESLQCGCPGPQIISTTKVTHWPAVLTIRINRFDSEGNTKPPSSIMVPRDLTLPTISGPVKYELYAMICHQGPSLHFGQFATKFLRHDQDKYVLYTFAENSVQFQNLKADQMEFDLPSAYLLFYEGHMKDRLSPHEQRLHFFACPFLNPGEIKEALKLYELANESNVKGEGASTRAVTATESVVTVKSRGSSEDGKKEMRDGEEIEEDDDSERHQVQWVVEGDCIVIPQLEHASKKFKSA